VRDGYVSLIIIRRNDIIRGLASLFDGRRTASAAAAFAFVAAAGAFSLRVIPRR